MAIPRLRREPVSSQDVREKLNAHLDDQLSNLTAVSALERLERLGSPRSSTDSSASLAKGMGEVVSSMATGFKGLSDIQNQMMQNLMNGKQSGGDSMAVMMQLFGAIMLHLLDQRGNQEGEDPYLKRLLDKQEHEIHELKNQRGMSPTDQQFHELMQKAAADSMQAAIDPAFAAKRLKEQRDHMMQAGLLTDGGGAKYRPGALQYEALMNERERIRGDHYQIVQQSNDLREWRQYGIPQAIAHGANALRDALGTFGLVPSYQGQQAPQLGQRRGFSQTAQGDDAAHD